MNEEQNISLLTAPVTVRRVHAYGTKSSNTAPGQRPSEDKPSANALPREPSPSANALPREPSPSGMVATLAKTEVFKPSTSIANHQQTDDIRAANLIISESTDKQRMRAARELQHVFEGEHTPVPMNNREGFSPLGCNSTCSTADHDDIPKPAYKALIGASPDLIGHSTSEGGSCVGHSLYRRSDTHQNNIDVYRAVPVKRKVYSLLYLLLANAILWIGITSLGFRYIVGEISRGRCTLDTGSYIVCGPDSPLRYFPLRSIFKISVQQRQEHLTLLGQIFKYLHFVPSRSPYVSSRNTHDRFSLFHRCLRSIFISARANLQELFPSNTKSDGHFTGTYSSASTNTKQPREGGWGLGNVLSPRPSVVSSSDMTKQTQEILVGRLRKWREKFSLQEKLQMSPSSRALRRHSTEFLREIRSVDGKDAYVAIGYGLANVVILRTLKGLILIDSLENTARMRTLVEDWRKNMIPTSMQANATRKDFARFRFGEPVLAVIYSHFHQDHIFGAAEIVEENSTQVWAHELTVQEIMAKTYSVAGGAVYRRSMRQFGTLLTEEEDGFINAGIGKRFDYRADDTAARVVLPTRVWCEERKEIVIGGEPVELVHAPGESRDQWDMNDVGNGQNDKDLVHSRRPCGPQTIIWFPRKSLLFGADNLYKAMPNVYAIRGTESRDAMLWVKSLDLMISFDAEVLVLGHTRPLVGQALVKETLMNYRDGIQFLHDQTVRLMNRGLPPEDIVQAVILPPHIQKHPYFQPFYGTQEWIIRGVFHHYMGWFSGQAEDLHCLPRSQKAEEMARLAGGPLKLLEHALASLERGSLQWALELSSHAQRLFPRWELVRQIRVEALRALAATETSAAGRNWMLTAAKEVSEERTGGETSRKLALSRAQKFWDINATACMTFRRGVGIVSERCSGVPDFHIITSDRTWRLVLTNELSALRAILSGRLRIKSGKFLDYWRWKRLMDLIERVPG